jgi:Arc/MetJ-type ribon-helix-helix transcriptional regulator
MATPNDLQLRIPIWYHDGMTTQIAVRLPDEQVQFLDDQVAAGRAASRAALITRLLAREVRRERALADLERMRAAGVHGNTDLDGLAAATGHRSLELD